MGLVHLEKNSDIAPYLPGGVYRGDLPDAINGINSDENAEGNHTNQTAVLRPYGPRMLFFDDHGARQKGFFSPVHPIVMDKITLILADGFKHDPSRKDKCGTKTAMESACGIIRLLWDGCFRTQMQMCLVLCMNLHCDHFANTLNWLSSGGGISAEVKAEYAKIKAEMKRRKKRKAGRARKSAIAKKAKKANDANAEGEIDENKEDDEKDEDEDEKDEDEEEKKSKPELVEPPRGKYRPLIRCYQNRIRGSNAPNVYCLNVKYVKFLFKRHGLEYLPEGKYIHTDEAPNAT